MKLFILTSVSLLAEYGDLDSMSGPEIHVTPYTSFDAAKAEMISQVEFEKNDAEVSGYSDESYEASINEKNAEFECGEKGSGCSWNLVRWEITEIDAENA